VPCVGCDVLQLSLCLCCVAACADKVTGTDQEKQEAAKHFAEINHAYETLNDAEKRQIYDQYGEEGLRQHAGQVGCGGGLLCITCS
jgi:hypothetical protein